MSLRDLNCNEYTCIQSGPDAPQWFTWATGLRNYGTPADVYHGMKHAYACGVDTERAAIVKWLRATYTTKETHWIPSPDTPHYISTTLADAIEKGEHLK